MDADSSRIPVRSRRQAMDWSLVLASQGIETRIEYDPEGPGWGLRVAPDQYEEAREAIRLYQVENRRWPWRQKVMLPAFTFDWTSLAWVLVLLVFFWLEGSPLDLRTVGLMDSLAVSHGEWWRLFTAIWLHADPGHLASNAAIGLLLLGLTMGRYGTGAGLLAAYLAGAGGNVVVWLLAVERHLNLGASGMVMGCLGLLAGQSFSLWRAGPRHAGTDQSGRRGAGNGGALSQPPERQAASALYSPLPSKEKGQPRNWPGLLGAPPAVRVILTGLVAGVMLFVLMGVSPDTDVLAHLGGFVCGVLLGVILSRIPRLERRPLLNLFCGVLFALLVIWPWWLAFAHNK